MNGLIIAQNVVIDGYGANINYSSSWADLVGTESEELSWTFDDWQYLADTDDDGLPNLIEKEIGSDPYNPDTDGDNLPDGYEALTLGTDPTKPDTDENGVSDYDEDFDNDGLSNGQEYELGTGPYNEDTDGDGLKDGEEINTYGTDPLKVDTDEDGLEDGDEIYFETDPLNPDSDGNGISDGDEKRLQTFIHEVENDDCAVTEVRVSMEGTGNLQKTTTVESIMNKDILCSDVVGLVGEPFSIETTSQFDKATLTYVVDKSKLGDTEFDNLLFLWYDEENYNFVELDTLLDEENSTVSVDVSVETTHFSKYMIVNREEWYKAWSTELYPSFYDHIPIGLSTVLVIDCSGSMQYNDPYEAGRKKAAESFINVLRNKDNVAIIAEDSVPQILCNFTSVSQKTTLLNSLNKIYSIGGNNFDASINESIRLLKTQTGAPKKMIIFMSDGGCSVSDSYLKTADNLGIPIYTIGFGNGSDDRILEHMANMTHGEFYKAITTNDLADIYSKIALDTFFDTEDTDDDGLYDVFELAGIRVQNGQIVHTRYDLPDTDHDGLEDGVEIEPVPIYKTIIMDHKEQEVTAGYYFIMNSNPESNDDSDGDGYSDIEDPYPLDKPDVLGDKYDFLDGETYYLAKMVGIYPEYYMDVKDNSTNAGAPLIMYNYTGNNNQKFKFEWCDAGYKIHALNNEKLVLTLNLNDDGSYSVFMGNDLNLQGQIWEVLPYNNGAKGLLGENGLVIRSKVLYYENNDTIGKPLYLSYKNNQISVSTDRINNARFMTCAIADWTRFGDAYMQYVGWTYTSNDKINRAMKNYTNNTKIGLKKYGDDKNIYFYNEKMLVINQSNGNFSDDGGLMFADVPMHGVICELMAAFNAATLAGENVNFFKTAAEFEYNALVLDIVTGGLFSNKTDYLKDGFYGSNPDKVSDWLDSLNLTYKTYKNPKIGDLEYAFDFGNALAQEMDSEFTNGNVAYFSYKYESSIELGAFAKVVTYQKQHSVAGIKDDNSGMIATFNRYSNYTEAQHNDGNTTYFNSIDEIANKEGCIFDVGYLIQKK
ncbi:VWA domain-containing protein [Ruminococcus sp. 210702-SL.1.03]|uniref:VWA domain-containing protein n=1 Tax=Ruminococcus sp. 210702-SL.1.03 TaxID=2883233 RepID=UPI001D05F25A|nr:VWA domain-containing protein [Ruminococcus sp. 210702-SL.1.03]MCB6615477.1 VWA domain-containing protein [Ruminococcus sp. 210702-SL.1.03]